MSDVQRMILVLLTMAMLVFAATLLESDRDDSRKTVKVLESVRP